MTELDRTLAFVKGRFGDHYRRSEVDRPRNHDEREWAFIPFTGGMVRHKSLLDLGTIDSWMAEVKPRHVYYSSARYDRPEAMSMNDKGWRGAELIFDLDADHLRDAEPDDTHAEMLAKCKESLINLLEFLESDLGFEDLELVFSGNRGYHIHVYDDRVQQLESEARREIVDYVQGVGFRPELAFSGETAAGEFGRTPTEIRQLNEGEWSARIRDNLLEFADGVAAMDDIDAVERLKEFENVGDKKAEKILKIFREKRDALESGNLDVASGMKGFWDTLITEAVEEERAETDEPVTTDIRRLIRLPGSLHGGTGLEVMRLEREELEGFNPLEDAVCDTFKGHEVDIKSEEETVVEVGGRSFNIEEGKNRLPEYAAIFAMLRTDAELG